MVEGKKVLLHKGWQARFLWMDDIWAEIWMEWEAQEPCDQKKKKSEPCGYGVEVGKSCEQN